MRVTIGVVGDDVAAARLNGVGARALNAAPVFELVARDLMADGRRRFDSNGFGRWPALDPQTIRRKSQRGQSPRVLEATGRLRAALTTPGAPGQRLDIGRDEMTFGLVPNGAAYYGRFHQAGRGVPKRLVLSATTLRRKQISDRVRSFIVNGE